MSAQSQLQAAWLRRGWLARLLLPLTCLYRAIVALRTAGYRRGWLRVERLPRPVLVVGNLIAGGAGKTPTTLALVDMLRARGYRPGIVSRGYGRASSQVTMVEPTTPALEAGDEPLLLRLRAQVPVAVGADRLAAARLLLAKHPDTDIILSDDGLQHLRLGRDAQVIVFDERGAGNGWLLPSGPLREPMPRELAPRTVILYNAPAASTRLRGHVATRRLSGLTSLTDWWSGAAPSPSLFSSLQATPVLAVAGLARPQRFFDMLTARGLTIYELALPDHHDFATLPWPRGTKHVIVTEKDAVKLRPDRVGETQVWVTTLDFELSAAFTAELMQYLPSPART